MTLFWLLLFVVLVVSLYHLLASTDRWHALLMVILVFLVAPVGLVGTANGVATLTVLHGEYLSAFTVGDQLLWGAAEPLRRMVRILVGR